MSSRLMSFHYSNATSARATQHPPWHICPATSRHRSRWKHYNAAPRAAIDHCQRSIAALGGAPACSTGSTGVLLHCSHGHGNTKHTKSIDAAPTTSPVRIHCSHGGAPLQLRRHDKSSNATPMARGPASSRVLRCSTGGERCQHPTFAPCCNTGGKQPSLLLRAVL